MATPAFGHKGLIQFAEEPSFNAWTTPTQRLRVLSYKPSQSGGFIKVDDLPGTLARKQFVPGPSYMKATMLVRMSYDVLTTLFRGAFGAYTPTLIETGVRDHVFYDSVSVVFNKSYSFEIGVGDVPAGKVFRQAGTKILGFTIKGASGIGSSNIVTVEFQLWAPQMDTNAGAGYTPTSLAEPVLTPVMFKHGVVGTDGTTDVPSTSIRITGFEVAYLPPLDEERGYLVTPYMDEPTRKDFVAPTWKLTQEFITTSALEKFRNVTSGALKIILQNPGTSLASHSSVAVRPQTGNTITRASGSFITDGVVIGDYVAPSATNGIAAGTYVTAVAALTVTTNLSNTNPGADQTILFYGSKELELRSGTAIVVGDPTPAVEGFGKLIQTSEWEAIHDATDNASLVMRLRNAEAALA